MVPMLSFILAAGLCRRCGAAIDRSHLAIEAAAALVGLVAFIAHPGVTALATAVFGWWLLLLAALDARHHWLPDKLTLPLLPAGVALALLGVGPALSSRAIGAVTGFFLLWGLASAYRALRGREGLGGGDPKLLAGLGAWLGWQHLPFVLLGAGLLGLLSLLLAHSRGIPVSATDRVPLGALMVLAAWPVWLLVAGPAR
jgi:leader peptidase (prepilin peptidase)/N-methyltransferase